jgi:hypothetical protein
MSDIDNQMTEESVDELLASIETPQPDVMDQPNSGQQEISQATQSQQAAQEYAIKYGGKEIKAPIEKILRWAEQGYEAPQKIGDLNKQLESWKSKEQQFKEIESKYKTVDDYVRQNPDWWQYIQNQYQQSQQQKTQDPNNQYISELKTQFEQQKSVLDTLMKEREETRIQKEDEQYNQNFETLKKQYPKVDFNSVDESGKSLEYRVLEYANKNSINNFTTAFKDYYFDDLMKIKETEAKEKLIKDKQANTKLGILNISSTPTPKRVSDNVRGKSYSDLEREALQELGIN